MRKIFLWIFWVLTLEAQASYVNQCLLNGVIDSTPAHMRLYINNAQQQEIEQEVLRFALKVTHTQPNGRADSGCAQKINQTIWVNLPVAGGSTPSLRRGQKITLSELIKDTEDMQQPMYNFTLIQPKHE